MISANTTPAAYRRFATADVPRNHEFGFWRDVIGDTYFNLQLAFKESRHFKGTLEAWNLGLVSLSKLECLSLIHI